VKIIKSMLLLCIFFSLCWVAGFLYYMSSAAKSVIIPEKSGAIVVLTGGSERIREAITLLQENYAPLLFVSGADKDVRSVDLLADNNVTKSKWSALKRRIIVGKKAVDTYSNAQEVLEWATAYELNSIILVTSNYHMPRAMVEFSVLPEKLKINPYPVISPNISIDNWWDAKNSRNFLIVEYHKYLGAFLRKYLNDASK
jgi:uncharacterized SAM-binding protein YcdF (DUF218 family)